MQCHGCFDLLHLGHIRHFAAAKQAGDRLVVTVTSDRFVNKGPGRPVFSQEQRAEAVAALSCVDEVMISDNATAANAIRTIRPAVFAKGLDYTDENLDLSERDAIHEVGAELLITQTEKFSSTALLQRQALSPDTEAYLAELRTRYTARDVRGWLEKARALNVLVIGDAIRDEYHYVDTLGKSGKDPMLAVKYVRADSFEGGVHAVGCHAHAVADTVMVTAGPVTVKRRFVEQYPFQKLFEVYELDEQKANDETPWLLACLPDQVADADLVIVADYGHGLLTPPVIALLTDAAKRLAVNTQANAGNHGFNTISKYPRADFISLSERELRLDARDQQSSIMDLMARRSDAILVTRGEKGCVARGGQGTARVGTLYSTAPALTTHTVDRTGAGDAVFAVTACLHAVGMPLDLLTFMASVVGTQAVGIVGNARYIERDTLHASIQEWLG